MGAHTMLYEISTEPASKCLKDYRIILLSTIRVCLGIGRKERWIFLFVSRQNNVQKNNRR